ncbi:hypothetical protein K9U39_06650 [Rhodoblastus acidophilus]|uniref:DUF945 domain-containing protein n=1 Tax=Candidatus Rhodoblastus alkanivorans TaxID=2954117 RepID=A0ABS9Z6P8_9HYPH|nr:hypothetical protein [Candidatus Rhodoblastus alkanivorans]MCI4679567.1 hypothetical protein [Candidatus Rhodoblastus alkanivorans]MCI4683318.1 hypothetical protein [Candidatus Rhodoblastus alkanivorans]MDI4640631.1 hypothetical protein [Rhodoblastus acidophilus]
MPQFFRAAFLFLGLVLAAAPAAAADLAIGQTVLNGRTGEKITFKNITLKDCNLTEDEATRLFSGALSREDAGAMLGRMTARELRIPEADVETVNGDNFTVKDIVAQNIAQGGAQVLSIGSTDGVLPDDAGDATLHLGALRVEKISMPGLAAALRAGDPGGAAFRFSHLAWEGGELSAVDKATPAGAPGGNRILLHVGAAKIDQNFNADGAPLDGAASLTGITLKMPPTSRMGSNLAAFGYSQLDADFEVAGAYDPATKVYSLKTYALDLKKIGRIALSARISGVGETAFVGEKAARQQALLDSTLDWAQIDVTNSGLFEKIVAFFSLSQGKTPEAVKSEWRAIIAQAPMLFSGASAVDAVAKELDRFIADPKVLTLRIKGKGAPLKLGELVHISNTASFLDKLEVTGSQGTSNSAKPAPGTRL